MLERNIVEIEVILSCKTVLRLSNQSAASNNFIAQIQYKKFNASSSSSKSPQKQVARIINQRTFLLLSIAA